MSAPPDDTTGFAVNLHELERTRAAYLRHRVLMDGTAAVIALVFGLALANVPGVRSADVTAAGRGHELEVGYAGVSRGGLATPFEIVVRRRGGFDGPLRIGVASEYLAMFDENGLDPQPSSETTRGSWIIWEFDRPPGDELSISFDARIEPGRQRGSDGRVAVLDEHDRPVVDARFHTTLFP